jgi:hypothetical protein
MKTHGNTIPIPVWVQCSQVWVAKKTPGVTHVMPYLNLCFKLYSTSSPTDHNQVFKLMLLSVL